eukprot:TRINITY_DN12973_c0_g1_i1.p1 TRINITY_DN12973_c0_g1~~TRINITY_DN12973_c0_g1_i1.p1  ORF type:complete len:166 (-),score=28.86 TRINITY_DN12973_c0_g1_i1:54-551(-)
MWLRLPVLTPTCRTIATASPSPTLPVERVFARGLHCSPVAYGSKETKQQKIVDQLTRLGVPYSGNLSHAKTTLNRFLRRDANHLGIKEQGNGNNRNLKDRLVPVLMKECKKFNLPTHGEYVDLRVRLANKKIFKKLPPFENELVDYKILYEEKDFPIESIIEERL